MPAIHPQLSRRNRRLSLFAALLAATALTPTSSFSQQRSMLKLLPSAVHSDVTISPKPSMGLKRLSDDIQVQPVQDAADNEGVLPDAKPAKDTALIGDAELGNEPPRERSSGINVPTQGATYRGVQSKLEMQPVAGPIFGRGNRSGQPFMRFLAPSRKTQNRQHTHRPIPQPPAARVAQQVPKPTQTDGWVARRSESNQTSQLPEASTHSPLSDPGSAKNSGRADLEYAASPSPLDELLPPDERASNEPRVIAPRGPMASTLEFKVTPATNDPPSIAASEDFDALTDGNATEISADETTRDTQHSVLLLRKQTDVAFDGPQSADDSMSPDPEFLAHPKQADIVELVAPKTSGKRKAVPSAEIVKRKLADLPAMDEGDSIREQVEREAAQQKELLAEESESESPRVASRSKSSEMIRAEQPSHISDDSEVVNQPITLDYIGMPAQRITVSPYVQQMKPGISRVLQYFYDRPEIAAGRSNWGMMHAIMVYGVDTRCGVGNESYSTIAWIAGNNICRGQRLLTQENGRLKAKSGVGLQGHQAQMLAVFSLCDVPPEYPLYAENTKYTMQHLIEEEKLACKSGEELTFTLIGLSHYLDTDTKWIASDGQRWDFERLIREELRQPINGAACGGTHRLMGYAHALRNRRAEGKPMTGQWARAEQYVRDFVNYTYSLQNRDGSMSTNWYEGRGDNRDVDRKIQTTGHMVEFLLTTTPDTQLQDPRLVRAIAFLANSMNRDLSHEWKIGPKGHALRSLAMYHDRVFKGGPAYRRQSIAQRPSAQGAYR